MSSLSISLGMMGVAYLYPLYASFKALTATSRRGSTPGAYRWHSSSSRHHLSEEEAAETEAAATELSELENWTMYWCIISVFWIFDRWLEWAFRWCDKSCYTFSLTHRHRVSLYAQLKLLFLCWLALPQTRVCISNRRMS